MFYYCEVKKGDSSGLSREPLLINSIPVPCYSKDEENAALWSSRWWSHVFPWPGLCLLKPSFPLGSRFRNICAYMSMSHYKQFGRLECHNDTCQLLSLGWQVLECSSCLWTDLDGIDTLILYNMRVLKLHLSRVAGSCSSAFLLLTFGISVLLDAELKAEKERVICCRRCGRAPSGCPGFHHKEFRPHLGLILCQGMEGRPE